MKRDPALVNLSRDHHHGLVVALKLTRATAADAAGARAQFLAFWDAEGRRHFAIEEDVLLPGCAHRVAADHEAVVRVLVEHVDLRRRARDLAADEAPAVETLHDLGARLRAHIRHEEEVLFPLIEAALEPGELAALGAEIVLAEGR